MNYTEKDFEKMLKQDEEVYVNLLQIEKIIKSHENSWTNGTAINQVEFDKLFALEQKTKEIRAKYEARQLDYQTNSTYQFGKTVSSWVSDFTDWMASSVGLNGGPAVLVVPMGWVVGIAVTFAAMAFFCGKYFGETKVDYAESLKVVAEVSKINPELANTMLVSLNKVKNKEIENSGLKVSTVLNVAAGIGFLYLVYTQRNKIGSYVNKLKNK